MKVEFLADIVARDVPVALAIRSRFGCRPGELSITTTFVGDGEKHSTLLGSRRFGADVLVTPWYNSARTLELLARARLADAKLVHFPSEQFFSSAFNAEKLNTATPQAYQREVDATFVWGEDYARRLVTEVGVPREKIYEVGSPRIEFSRASHVSGRGDANRPRRVLFVSDFTVADLDTPRLRRRFNDAYKVGLTSEDVEQLADERAYMIDTACQLSVGNGFEVRIRPHPGERIEPYLDGTKGGSAVVADPAQPMAGDVAWADVVVGYTSTSIFEVVAAGKPFLSLRRKRPPDVVWRPALEAVYSTLDAPGLMQTLNSDAALKDALSLTEEHGTFCIGNLKGDYDPLAAFWSALGQLVDGRGESSRQRVSRTKVCWGCARSIGKYAAYRFFLSGLWRKLGGPLPQVVRRRTSPGHVLTGAVLASFEENGLPVSRSANVSEPQHAISWRLGDWCWRPAPVEAESQRRRV